MKHVLFHLFVNSFTAHILSEKKSQSELDLQSSSVEDRPMIIVVNTPGLAI